MADSYETFNALARKTLEYPTLPRDELTKTFLQIEEHINYGIATLVQSTSFVEDNLCYLLAEIAAGLIKSRKVYREKKTKRKISVGEDVEVGSTNSRIFAIGFDLFKLSKTDRTIAVPRIHKIIRGLRLSTSVYENILTSFLRETENYCETSDRLAELTLKIKYQKAEDRRPLISDMQTISDLIDELRVAEMSAGSVRPNYLYGTRKVVQQAMNRVRSLQEKILKAYLRLVPSPARKKSASEVEALDLFQSGSLGLSRAISLYNVRKGASFPSFANQWIRQKILGSVKHSSPLIRLPTSVWEAAQRIRAAERQLQSSAKTRDTYTDKDISALLDISVHSLNRVREKMQRSKVVSLASVTPDSDREYEFLRYGEDSDEDSGMFEVRSSIEKILGHINPEDRRLVCLKYGYLEGVPNDEIERLQVVSEMLQQLGCSARQMKSTTTAAERFELRSEKLDNI